jgi:PilZ domain
MERRRYQRIFPQGLSAEISDGIGFYKGVVSNVSMNGLMIEDLPSRIDGKAPWYIVVVKDRELSFRIFLKPKWSVLEETNRFVGGMIVDPSWDWADFVHTLAAKAKDR